MNTINSHVQKIEFSCDGKLLKGMLHLPDMNMIKDMRPPLVVGSHGLEGSMESAKQILLSRILPERGVAFLRFDHRGCGSSEGDFVTETSLSKRVKDMLSAIDHVAKLDLTDHSRLLLFGSSLGGSTCISAWSRLCEHGFEPSGAVLCAAPVNSLTISQIPLQGNERRPSLPMSFFEDNLMFDLTEKLSAIHHLLIFHGDQDQTVPVENAYTIHSNAGEPKKMVILKGGDHQMSDLSDQKKFEGEFLLWLNDSLGFISDIHGS
ncbi:alpha/beta hydrolase [Desulfamplus magnetovallimortis]|nr:alpha/beta hydrolase [Desulfamplus magnetovallimortis]